MPLKLKIFVAFFLISIMSVAVLGGMLTKVFYDVMMNSLSVTEQKNSALIMKDIDSFIGNLSNMTEAFVLDEEIKDMLFDIQQNGSFANYNSHSNAIFSKLFIYGHNVNRSIWRMCIYSQDAPYPFISTRKMFESDLDVATKPWYQPLMASVEKRVVYGVHEEGGTPCVTVARPIFQTYTHRLLGVIAVDVKTDAFVEFWRHAQIGDGGFEPLNYLQDAAGQLIAASDTDGWRGHDEKRAGGQYIRIKTESTAYGWRFVTLIPRQWLSSKLSALWAPVMVFFALVLLLCLGGTWLLSNVVTRPIQRIYMNILQLEQRRSEGRVAGPSVSDERLRQGFDKMTNQIAEITEENNAIQAKLQRADLMVRQAQINPHFIYNTLNSIKWMADMQGAKRIVSALDATIRLLRFSAKKDETLVSIRDELDFCSDYMNLVGLRNLDSVEITYALQIEHPERYRVPRFILQPILENAVVHGFQGRMAGNRIIIGIGESDGLLRFTVWDNGQGMDQGRIDAVLGADERDAYSFNQIGIFNVDSRIKHIYGDRFGVSIVSEPGQFTEVAIRLPAITEEAEHG